MNDANDELEIRLAAIERRLSALESGGARAPLAAGDELPPEHPAANLREETVSSAATHLGRVLLIFGGAYLLRAITDFGFLPIQAGIPLGMTYAVFWLYIAYRVAGDDRHRVAAMLYGAVSVLLALPVLVEAVTRFELLSGTASAVALSVFCAAALWVAAVRDLRVLGWLATAGGALAAGILLKGSGATIPFAVFLLALGLASLWLVYWRRWAGLQWLGAAGANLAVVLMAVLSRHEQWAVDPFVAYYLGIGLWASYLLSFALASQARLREPGIFEVVQAVLASAVAGGVGMLALEGDSSAVGWLGALALALGAGSYGLAFKPAARADRGRDFYFFSALGLGLVVAGSALLLPAGAAAAIWALMALAMAWLSGRYRMVSLSLQSALLLVAAALASDALTASAAALVGDPAADWPGMASTRILVAVAAALCLFIPVAQSSERWGTMAGLPQLLTLVLAVWTVSGLMVVALAPTLAGVPGESPDLGKLAALRTAILAASAVTLALSSRYRRWPEARWLAYPVIAAVGLKLLIEDFPNGRPMTLFMALAVVGGALILVSKLLPRSRPRRADA